MKMNISEILQTSIDDKKQFCVEFAKRMHAALKMINEEVQIKLDRNSENCESEIKQCLNKLKK